jgi:WD40 repeat protein
MTFTDDGQLLISAAEDGILRVWHPEDGRLAWELPRQANKVLAIHRLPGDRLAVAGSDNRITLWDLTNQRQIDTLTGHTGSVASLDVEHGLLASGSFDTSVRVWEIGALLGSTGRQEASASARLAGTEP